MNTQLKIKQINPLREGLEDLEMSNYYIQEFLISDFLILKNEGNKVLENFHVNKDTGYSPIIILTLKSDSGYKNKVRNISFKRALKKSSSNEAVNTKLISLSTSQPGIKKAFNPFTYIQTPKELKKVNSFLYNIHMIIDDNLDNYQFSVEVLAKELHMSRMQVHRKLKAYTNRSASNYIRSYRLYKSKSQLGDRDGSISEIAWNVGFNDVNYYSKSFRMEFGMSPSAYQGALYVK